MKKGYLAVLLMPLCVNAQLPLVRDTITVIENGYVLKMPWANGINYANVSSIDLNLDGRKDIVVFDRYNQFSEGRFRCFINTGNTGALRYRADTYMSYLLPQANSWAAFADYNGDGKEDLFCAGNNLIMVYKNVSSAAFTPSFTLVKPFISTDGNPGGNPIISPLYSSVIGAPGIADVDNDGDLDILTFTSSGSSIDFHKNLSMEKYGHADSLVFANMNDCWGNVWESGCQVDYNQCQHKPFKIGMPGHAAKELHAGSCLACFDSDGDQDKDLMMGDIGCNRIIYAHNAGTPAVPNFNDSTSIFPNFKNNNTVPIRITNFPCVYNVDVDADGKKDLVASPNAFGSENYKSMWYYRNASGTATVDFQYVKNNLFQDEMIEVGQNSFPTLIDYDGDGKKDLLIGTYGYFDNKKLNAKLTLYKNTGTSAKPTFSLVSRDYAGLGAYNLNFAIPAVGDVDADGDVDICIGTSSGQIHWLENTAGAGNPCNFSVFKLNPFQFTTFSSNAAPQLFDLDGDDKLDLLIGTKNGNVSYYRCTATGTAPAFSLMTTALGSVNVALPILGPEGYAVPYFYKDNGTKLLLGSVSGKIYQYSVPFNELSAYTQISSFVNGLYEGGQSSPCYEDINGDSKRDLLVGNASGGLCFFSSKSPLLGEEEQVSFLDENDVLVFPNPARHKVNLRFNKPGLLMASVNVLDALGKSVLEHKALSPEMELNISLLDNGIYFLECNVQTSEASYRGVKKLVVRDW